MARESKSGNPWRRIARLLWPFRGQLVSQVAVAVLLVASEGLGGGGILVLLGGGNPGGRALAAIPGLGRMGGVIAALSVTSRIRIAALVLILSTLLRSGLLYLQNLQGLLLRRSVEHGIELRLLGKLHELPIDILHLEKAGGLLTLVNHHTRRIGQLTLASSQAIANLVVLVAYTGLALLVSWKMTMLILVLLAPIALVLRPMIGGRLRSAGRATRDLTKELAGLVQDNLAAMRLIRLYDRCEWSLARIRQALQAMHAAEYRSDRLVGLTRPLNSVFNSFALAVLMVGSSFLLAGAPTSLLISLAMFLFIAFRLVLPVTGLAGFQGQLNQAGPTMEEIDTFLTTIDHQPLPDGDIPFDGLRDRITFAGVTFQYVPSDPPVLQGIDLTLPVGKTTALVGASGAGKSSLVNLLTRFYDPTAGGIFIDGIDLRRMQVSSWRRKVAVVSQEVFLFHASVWDNLRFARPTATEAEIVSACQMAQIHDFILSLPEGYATMLQERGQRLSGGQRQRIALARALLVEGADLLVFDEATSELDAPTEEAVYRALAQSTSASTRLIIAHRLSVVRNADWIVVLEKGRVKEQGTHDQLLTAGGAYARLARVQDPSPATPSPGNTPGH